MKELSLSGHTHSNYALKSHTHSASQITSGTLSVSRGGTGVTSLSALASAIYPYLPTPGTGSVIDGNLTLGNTVIFDNIQWIVCHIDHVNNKAYLACNIIAQQTKFNGNSYASSTLKTVAKSFEDNMSDGAKSRMVNTTVEGVTSKIFVASHEQMYGSFLYFNSDEGRVCQSEHYWTSSPSSSGRVWVVYPDGTLDSTGPNNTFGFRPFCAVSLT